MANVLDVANLFLNLAEEQANNDLGDLMTDMKLQKMLYFAQCWHLVRHGEPLFDNKIEAWKHGPVVPEAYQHYKHNGWNPILSQPVHYEAFTADELETILDVFHYYGRFSASGLRELSHKEGTPWSQVYQEDAKHIEIMRESLKDYYSQQQPLETFKDRLNRKILDGNITVTVPRRDAEHAAILPADEYEDWGENDDD